MSDSFDSHRDPVCREDLERIFSESVKSVDPYPATMSRVSEIRERLVQSGAGLNVIGFGKASPRMVQAVEDSLLDYIKSSIVITKYRHSLPLKKTEVIEASHPLPDLNGLKGTKLVMKKAVGFSENDLTLCLISGGGSALLTCPADGVGFEEKQKITELLLKAGADIFELNTVRKHISAVKGGRLAELLYPSQTVSLILSDVIGDRLDVIASGPTAPDETSYLDALKVLRKYALLDSAPKGVMKVIMDGTDQRVSDTPSSDNALFRRVDNVIIGSNSIAIRTAKREAERLGYSTEIVTSAISGESREAARWLAGGILSRVEGAGSCFISGGETTVTVTGGGLGGRSIEFALSFAIEIEGMSDISLLSAGTDGTDGPTDAAGAIVDGQTVVRARKMGVSPEKYLEENDSYNFFRKVGGLFITGPTGTNVMDLQVVIRR